MFLSIVFLMCASCVLGQSKKQLNAQLIQQLEQAKVEQDSISRLWKKSVDDVWNWRKTTKYQFSPEYHDRINKCKSEIYTIQQQLVTLKKLTDAVVDTVDNSNEQVAEAAMRSLRISSQYSDAINKKLDLKLMPDSLHLDGKKKSEQNNLMTLQLAAYEAVQKENLAGIATMHSWIDSLPVAKKQIQVLNSELFDLHLRLVEYRFQLSNQLTELQRNYEAKKGKGFPPAYKEVFGDFYDDPPVIIDMDGFYGDGKMTTDGDFGYDPPPPTPRMEVRDEPSILEIVEESAEFPGGRAALLEYLASNMKLPEIATELGISGKVYLRFVISDQGDISNVMIKKGIADCPECDKEALRVVKAMPKWKPARNNGKAVNSYYNLPVLIDAQ